MAHHGDQKREDTPELNQEWSYLRKPPVSTRTACAEMPRAVSLEDVPQCHGLRSAHGLEMSLWCRKPWGGGGSGESGHYYFVISQTLLSKATDSSVWYIDVTEERVKVIGCLRVGCGHWESNTVPGIRRVAKGLHFKWAQTKLGGPCIAND